MTSTAPLKKRAAPKPIPVTIDNVGGIHHAELLLKPGVNELVGANGSGKTSALQAIRRAFGDKSAAIEKRDGAVEGRITVPGLTVKIGKLVKATGEAELEIQDAGPVTRIIDPGIKGSDEAASARVRAFVELLQPEFDAASLAVLAGNDAINRDVQAEYRENAFDNLSDAADRVKRIADRHARAAETEAKAAAGVATAAEQAAAQALEKAGGEEALVATPVAEAEQAESTATSLLAIAKENRRRRLALELQQNEIRETLGEKPDPAHFDLDIQLRSDALLAAEEKIREHERAIAQIREQLAGTRADRTALLAAKTTALEHLLQWMRQSAILAQVPKGPEQVEVTQLELDAQRATETRRAAVVSAQVRSQLEQAAAEKAKRDAANAHADELRSIATTVYDRMAELPGIAERAGRFAIVVGRLHVKDEHGNLLDFETRQSAGQKVRAVLEVAASLYGAGSIVGLEDRYWQDLDDERQREFSRIAADHGLAVVTCRATTGDLAIHHVGASSEVLA